MFEHLALLLRGVAIGFALLVLLSCCRDRQTRRALAPLLICLMGYVIRSAPQMQAAPTGLLVVLSVAALLFPVAFWWLVRVAFDDRTDMSWPAGLAGVLLVVSGLGSSAAEWQAMQKALGAAFTLAALWRLGAAGPQDLVSGRRRIRVWLLAYTGLHGLAVLAVELYLRGRAAPAWLDALNVVVIGAGLCVTGIYLLRADALAIQTLFGPEPQARQAPDPAPADDTSADDQALERLEELMSVQRLYRDPELKLAGLSERLGLPEYRLRELINQRLGHRNFPAFVNAYRLAEVEARLEDPSLDRRPILTLALEAGFGSIGPFNRAFKERHGQTPTEFRSRRSGGALA